MIDRKKVINFQLFVNWRMRYQSVFTSLHRFTAAVSVYMENWNFFHFASQSHFCLKDRSEITTAVKLIAPILCKHSGASYDKQTRIFTSHWNLTAAKFHFAYHVNAALEYEVSIPKCSF